MVIDDILLQNLEISSGFSGPPLLWLWSYLSAHIFVVILARFWGPLCKALVVGPLKTPSNLKNALQKGVLHKT